MPQRLSGLKELVKNRRRHMHNLDIKTDIRKTAKKFNAFIEQKNVEEAKKLLSVIHKKLDKSVKTKMIHKNNAARKKSQFSRLLQSIVK